ncbi:hypothetical protein CWATWH0402_136 [Crocosphaera watsonii WH 0402]|uniref:Uncharacterized protein n=1 Tax=Crocosphaera watsonii WH 0402 TaxID=1284629 RepID=T2JW11_CROWT|nr:hypothetical protein CWATWH0402_136 [Crocosphaera watsonii WH 0402]
MTKEQKDNLNHAWKDDKTIEKTVECIDKFWNSNSTTNDISDPCS